LLWDGRSHGRMRGRHGWIEGEGGTGIGLGLSRGVDRVGVEEGYEGFGADV
jgi:hypothetical protein